MSADFLLELLSEEIPARMQARARSDLAAMFAAELDKASLGRGEIETYSTPRRLILIARDLATETAAAREELKGPRSSAPPQALEGFLRKTGLTRDALEDRDGIFYAVTERPGREAGEVIAEAVASILATFPWPKSMRWGSGSERWVRPLQGIVAILGETIVPVSFGGVTSGATTLGHRFHHPGQITVGGAYDYVEKLRACHVIVDQDERERLVREGAEAAAAAADLALVADEALVVENAGLTEWPVPLLGRFDVEFLDVPREVIVLTMRTNQKYFACTDGAGALAPAFVCTANIDADDGGKRIVEGNRRVLAARLSDARFFWEQDLKVPLDSQAEKLSQIVFHEKLGTVADKVERVAKLARWLCEEKIVPANPATAERAARLAKADLVTGMVGEFPELQGVIGGYLAAAQGEPPEVSDAVRDHYKPMGQGDDVPSAPVTIAVSLADKLDTIAAFFYINERPTGSKDPYALRRAALGVITLIASNELRTSLRAVLGQAFLISGIQAWARLSGRARELDRLLGRQAANFGLLLEKHGSRAVSVEMHAPFSFALDQRLPDSQVAEAAFHFADAMQVETLPFFGDRIAVQQRELGVRADLIKAVFSLGEDDLVRLLARVQALQAFVATAEGTNLLAGYKRASNILKKEDWTAPEVMSSDAEQHIPQTGEEDPLVLVEEPGMAEAIAEMAGGSAGADMAPQEQALIDALDAAEPRASSAVEAEDFTAAMGALASLRGPIDAFFDHVKVNDPDTHVRARRLNLLLRFRDAVHHVADFSKIEG